MALEALGHIQHLDMRSESQNTVIHICISYEFHMVKKIKLPRSHCGWMLMSRVDITWYTLARPYQL